APLQFALIAGRHGALLFGTRVQDWRMVSLSSWRTNRPRHRARCASIKNLLRLEVVQSSRFSPRRADASKKRPARGIAGGEALFQTFICLFFGPLDIGSVRLGIRPAPRVPAPLTSDVPSPPRPRR